MRKALISIPGVAALATWRRTQWGVRLLLASMVLLSASPARATILGLGDGTYDVTLTCIIVNCGGPFDGTIKVVGDDVTEWSFTFLRTQAPLDLIFDVTFSGNPTEFDNLGYQRIEGPGDVFYDPLIIDDGAGWNMFENSGISILRGTWVAVRQDESQDVPEPLSTVLLLSGLVALSLRGNAKPRLRRSGAS